MKKRSKSLLLLLLLAVAFAIFACAGILIAKADDNHSLGLSEPLVEKVKVGDVVMLPEYYVEVNGKSVKAQPNVITPQGKTYTGTKFVANEAGRYTVRYVMNGKVVDTEYCMAVIGATDLISVNALASIDGIKNYAYKADDDAFKGVAVDIQSGATITYAQEIPTSSLTKDDLLFEATVEPKVKGEADFKKMIITLADANDSSVYFRVSVVDGSADGGANKHLLYVNAAANGQTTGGMNYDNTSSGPYWQPKDIYGTSIFASFRAETNAGGLSEYSFKLYYDANENALYACRYEKTTLVADFDDPVIFGTTAWSGFKSGKAKLTVSFADVKGDGGRVILNTVRGLPLVDDEILDTVAPELTIDLLGESKAPNSELGTEYAVFPYSTYDYFDSSVKVAVSVTHQNVSTGKITDVSVKNGKFVTNKLGTYTITYVASDYSGNETTKTLTFECIAKAEDIVVTSPMEDFSATVFEKVEIVSTAQVKAAGGLGNLNVSLTVYDPDGEVVDLDHYSFVPEKLGKYRFVYTATDFYGKTGTTTVLVDVEANDKTLFLNEITLPELLIAGFKYTIPQIFAKTCSDGKVVDCQIDYYVNGTKLDSTRTFTASGKEATIECRAYAKNAAEFEKIEKTATVVDGKGGKDQTAYFYVQEGNVTVTETLQSVDLTATSNATVEFANKLKGESFSLGVQYRTSDIRFSELNIVLCDADDSSKTVTFKFDLSQGTAKITVPYGQKTDFTTNQGFFQFNFDSRSGIVSDANNSAMAYADKDDAGNDFTAFASGLYVKFAFVGVSGSSKISLSTLNNQPLGFRSENESEIGDSTGPEIVLAGELATTVKAGDDVTIFAANAYDVLNQIESITVRVQSPDFTDVLSERAATQDVSVKLTEIGYYRVTYTAFDTVGNRTRSVIQIRVIDSTPPSLSVQFEDMTKTVGETVALPTVSASDNSGTVYYDIFVTLPNNIVRLVLHSDNGTVTSYLTKNDTHYPSSFKASDNEFNLEMRGKYVVTVMAYDADYNVTMQSFTITVRGAAQ